MRDEERSDTKWGDAHGSVDTSGDCPDIWIDPDVKRRIGDYLATDTGKELVGVLLGDVVTDSEGALVRVLAEIGAKYTEAVHTSGTFTEATWADIQEVKDRDYPDLRVVGWYHSHPDFGIFMSRWDVFIQKSFFNLPWQIAYVVDPVNKSSGFFRWNGGEVVDAEISRRELRRAARMDDLDDEIGPVRSRLFVAMNVGGIALLCGAVVYLGFFRPPKVKVVQKVVEKVRVVHETPAPDEPPPREYTVQPRDNLWSIARREYGNGNYVGAIAKFNGITISKQLSVGTKLKIPSKQVADQLGHK